MNNNETNFCKYCHSVIHPSAEFCDDECQEDFLREQPIIEVPAPLHEKIKLLEAEIITKEKKITSLHLEVHELNKLINP